MFADLNSIETFVERFQGSPHSHGQWHKDRAEPAETVMGPATAQDSTNHLAGGVGLGVVPVRPDGTCRFGAIDIDNNAIDLAKLAAEIARRRFPLVVCRSKSGGAHLYCFLAEPGLSAVKLREYLRRWAALLGFPSAEIFPKQNIVGNGRLGNWINLPYFACERSVRYAVGPDGRALTLSQFLAGIRFFDEASYAGDETPQAGADAMPPCLARIWLDGIQDGVRNQALFNFDVYFKNSDPDRWKEKLDEVNRQRTSPPLRDRELGTIRHSLAGTDYQHTCLQSPIREFCDRAVCVKLKFGVGFKAAKAAEYDAYTLSDLQKIETTPPSYIVKVNGRDLELSDDDLWETRRFKRAVGNALDLVIQPLTQPKWDMVVRKLIVTMTRIDAPPDASLSGQIIEILDDFLSYYEKSRSREDILRGLPVLEKPNGIEEIWFRSADFRRHLLARKPALQKFNIWSLLHQERDCVTRPVKILGKTLHVWIVPLAKANIQREEFGGAEEIGPKPEVPL
jgi:hypothetical protein